MKHKVSELSGAELDAAVALAISTIDPIFASKYGKPLIHGGRCLVGHGRNPEDFHVAFHGAPAYVLDGMAFCPSTKWEHGGPIIEREQISVEYAGGLLGWGAIPGTDGFGQGGPENEWYGDTLLIAAMRCYVESKFGDEVDL